MIQIHLVIRNEIMQVIPWLIPVKKERKIIIEAIRIRSEEKR